MANGNSRVVFRSNIHGCAFEHCNVLCQIRDHPCRRLSLLRHIGRKLTDIVLDVLKNVYVSQPEVATSKIGIP
jgi:hypothetical protein